MHRLPYLLSNLILLLSGLMTAAQASGDLNGRILDEANEPVPNANVLLYAGTEYISGVAADDKGIYGFDGIRPGYYKIVASAVGYKADTTVTKVNSGELRIQNIKLRPDTELGEVRITAYREDLVSAGGDPVKVTISSAEIKNHPSRQITNILVDKTPRVYQKRQGQGGINISGARTSSTQYYIDGIRVLGDFNMPISALQEVQVYVGGIPARYGDVTGGVIEITTKSYMDFWDDPRPIRKKKKRKLPEPQGPPADE